MNVFMANVGNRDIALRVDNAAYVMFSKGEDGVDGKYGVPKEDLPSDLRGCEEGTRYLSGAVKNNFATHKDNLRFPIIGPALKAVLGRDDVDKIDKIVLFATDQPKGKTKEEYRRWDTIESAYVLKGLICAQFAGQIGGIDVVPVGFNPSQHEPAYKFIGEKFVGLNIDKQARVLASIKGGIPAMNSALRERVVQHFGPRAWLVETDEPTHTERWDGTEGGTKITSSWPFRQQSVLRLLEDFLNRHDYSAAWRLLTFHAVKSKEVEAYVEHALARTNLDFDGAAARILSFASRNQEAKEWMNSAKDKSGLQRLDDLAESAQVAFERRDYVGFLNRVKTFYENCLDICKRNSTLYSNVWNDLQSFNGLCTLRNTLDHGNEGASLSDLKGAFPNVGKEFRPLTGRYWSR